MSRSARAFGLLLGLWLIPAVGMAQVDFDFGVDTVLEDVLRSFDDWMFVGIEYARFYFIYFATMQIVWSVGWVVLGGGALPEVLVTFTKEFMRQGVFFAIIVHAKEWVPGVIDSLRGIGQHMAHQSADIRPEAFAAQGVATVGTIWENFSIITPGEGMALLGGGVLLFLLWSWVSLSYYLTLLDAKFVLAAGSVLLGLGGSHWTAGFARRYIEYAVRAGLKLLVLELIFSLFRSQLATWLSISGDWSLIQDFRTMIAVAFGVLLMAVTVWSVPGLVAGMASGALVSSGEAVVTRVATSVASSMAGAAIGGAISAGMSKVGRGGGAASGGGAPGGSRGGVGGMSATERAASASNLGSSVWGGIGGGAKPASSATAKASGAGSAAKPAAGSKGAGSPAAGRGVAAAKGVASAATQAATGQEQEAPESSNSESGQGDHANPTEENSQGKGAKA